MKFRIDHPVILGLVALLVNSAWTPTVLAQQFPCPIDIPVNVMMPDGALVRKLSSDAFVVKSKERPVPFNMAADEPGPRRILFVVETGGRIKKEARMVEEMVLSQFVAKVRVEDSFALLSARGPRQEVPFGSGREAFTAALQELYKGTKGKNQPGDVLDVVKEGIKWFHQPQPGDAIVLITMGIGYPPGPAYRQVGAALAASHIRLFGCQLGLHYSGYYFTGVQIDGVMGPRVSSSASIDTNLESVFALSDESGGAMFYENTDGNPHKAYKLTDVRKQEMERLAGQLYKAIVEYYHLKFALPAPDLTIDLADPVRKQLSTARVIFPKRIPSCSVKPKAIPTQ